MALRHCGIAPLGRLIGDVFWMISDVFWMMHFDKSFEHSPKASKLTFYIVFNDFNNEIKKTKEMSNIIKKFEISNSLIILDKISFVKIEKSI